MDWWSYFWQPDNQYLFGGLGVMAALFVVGYWGIGGGINERR